MEEVDGAVDVGCFVEKNADPAAVGEDVVGLGAACGDQFIADFLWERDVDEAIAVDVADFASREVVFRAAKAMRLGCDAGPGLNCGIDFLFRSVDWHFDFPRYRLDATREMLERGVFDGVRHERRGRSRAVSQGAEALIKKRRLCRT